VRAWYRPASWLARPPQQRQYPPAHATGREGGPGNTGNGSLQPFLKKEKHRKSLRRPVAAVAALPACWLAPAPGANSPESALGVGPRLPRARRPGHPRFWRRKGTDLMGRANPGPFLNVVPDLSGIGTSRDLSGVTPPMLFRASVR
jgi:hypothetical protein